MRNFLFLLINGKPQEIRGRQVFSNLSDFLRTERSWVGTKVVCAEGDCGACTVLIGKPGPDGITYRPINSCIQQMHQLDGCHVITVEGLQGPHGLHSIQRSMIRCHGAQCGFCTPGFVTALAGLLEENTAPEPTRIRDALTGNLCRCTGYEPIIKAAMEVDPADHHPLHELYPPDAILRALAPYAATPVAIEADGRHLASPLTLDDAVAFKTAHPEAVVIQGGTDVGVWCNKRGFIPPAVLTLSKIAALHDLKIRDGVAVVGAAVTLHALEAFFEHRVPAFHAILRRFGSPQIRYSGTLAGNLINASPIADSLPFLHVMGARLMLAGPHGTRAVAIGSFYRAYKTMDMAADEILASVHIPLPAQGEVLRLYKVSKRRDMDIATFTAAIRLTQSQGRIEHADIACGGVGPVVVRLTKTEQSLRGQAFTEATFARAGQIARSEIEPISDVRGSRGFRLQLAENILSKFYHEQTAGEVRT